MCEKTRSTQDIGSFCRKRKNHQLSQNFRQIFCNSYQKTIDRSVTVLLYYQSARPLGDALTARKTAMKREIAREGEVTSVEYVRYRRGLRYAIGRLKPICTTRISHGRGIDRLGDCQSRFVFRTWSDTHGSVYKISASSVRPEKGGDRPPKIVRKKEKRNPWQATTRT